MDAVRCLSQILFCHSHALQTGTLGVPRARPLASKPNEPPACAPTVLGLQVSAPDFYTGAENCNSGLGAYAVLLSSEPPHLGF